MKDNTIFLLVWLCIALGLIIAWSVCVGGAILVTR